MFKIKILLKQVTRAHKDFVCGCKHQLFYGKIVQKIIHNDLKKHFHDICNYFTERNRNVKCSELNARFQQNAHLRYVVLV